MTGPAQTVERFLELLTRKELDAAANLLATDVEYSNVSLPTIWGRSSVRQALARTLGRHGVGGVARPARNLRARCSGTAATEPIARSSTRCRTTSFRQRRPPESPV